MIHENERLRQEQALAKVRHLSYYWKDGVAVGGANDGVEALHWLKRQVKAQEGCTEEVQMHLLRRMFPELPQEVALGLVCPPDFDAKKVPYNRRVRRQLFDCGTPTLLHLFSGTQKWKRSPGLVLNVELEGADLSANGTFGKILKSVVKGAVHAALAGPPCRTSSACRRDDDGGPRPVRSRGGPRTFWSLHQYASTGCPCAKRYHLVVLNLVGVCLA